MAQVTLYLPDRVALQIKLEAKKAHKSVSAFVTELASRRTSRTDWPRGFGRLYGSWKGAAAPIDDPPPDDVEPLT